MGKFDGQGQGIDKAWSLLTAGLKSMSEEFYRMQKLWKDENLRLRDTISEQQKEIEKLREDLTQMAYCVKVFRLREDDAKEVIERWGL